MAFVKVTKSRIGAGIHQSQPMISMGAYLADGKVHKSRSVAFRITYALIEQLGWPLAEGKIGVSVLEGTGVDQGYVQLVHDDAFGYRGSQGSTDRDREHQGVSISLTAERFKHYVLNECPVVAGVVNHIVDGNVLIVECPDWLRYNPSSVPQEEKVPVQETKRPLPRVNSVDQDEVEVRLNRQERRALAHHVTRVLKR